jgi:gamma-glutamyltranspeptidase
MDRRLSARGERFAIATPHVAATAAGRAAFEDGGNAVDAALAAATTLAVVYPHMCGVGGDLFALVHEPEGRTIALNASGAAPLGTDTNGVRRDHEVMPTYGPLTITVPGAVSGWSLLAEDWSRHGLARALAPAIAFARDGVPVTRSLAAGIAWEPERLQADPGLSAVFCPTGHPLAEGERVVQPALAETLAAVATDGAGTLYGGPVGKQLTDGLRTRGSAMTLEDLARHAPEVDSPLTGRYRDLHVSVVPPNSQGFVLLEILAAIEALGVDPDPLGPDATVLAEVFHATAVDRDRHNADPRAARVPVGTLLDEGHIAGLRDAVREHLGGTPGPRHHGDTIALVAADAEGWAISLIQSLYNGFGSGILEPTTGIVCHNRGSAFVLEPDHPNALAPGKRPAHTLMPVLVRRDGELAAVSGSMGGGAQPQINAMSLIRAFDLGMSAGDVLDVPRWLVGGMALRAGRTVEAEARVPVAVRRALDEAGFTTTLLESHDEEVGHAHLIRRLPGGGFDVGTDPRADGEVGVG